MNIHPVNIQPVNKVISSLLPCLLVFFSISACGMEEDPAEGAMNSSEITSPDMNIPDEYKIGGFAVGTQAYTFNRFSVDEAIEKTAAAGGRVIELYPGQTLSPEEEDVDFTYTVSDDIIEQVLEKLNEHDIMVVNFGVVGLQNPEQAREVFEFAQKLGIPAITTNIGTSEELDFIEPLVEEFGIKVAIHNHPRREDDPEYRIWDPQYVVDLLSDRDPRIGASADTGHWIRSGLSPVDALQILEARVVSVHLKDVNRTDTDGEDVIFGTGLGNTKGVLQELRRQNFGGHISIEYESNWYDNVPDVAQNVGFIRGWAEAAGE